MNNDNIKMTDEEMWENLENQCKNCTACELGATRTNCVFGKGNRNTDLMFVGEAPGEQEDKQGIPFVGASGKLFDKFLTAVDISHDEIYVTNILKCRPPKNRDPLPTEVDACMGYLRTQVKLIKPKMIVCLGRIAAMQLIKPDFKITQEHGIFFNKGSYEMCAVYHPSALLRDPKKKEDMLTDMKMIKEKLDSYKSYKSISEE